MFQKLSHLLRLPSKTSTVSASVLNVERTFGATGATGAGGAIAAGHAAGHTANFAVFA